MRFVVTHMTADPRITAAKMQNITILAIFSYSFFCFGVKRSDFEVGAAVDDVRQRAALVHFLVEVKHECFAVEYRVLEIVYKLDCVEVAGVHAEFAEHAVAEVVLIVDELLFLLACLRVLNHLRHDLDGAVRASLLAECTSCTLHDAVLVAVHHQTSAVACCYVQCGLAVLGILLSALRCEVLLPGGLHTYGESLHSSSDFSEI